MIERYLLILLAVVLIGSIGAFFLLVAILPVITTALVLTGLAATFGLGFHAGRKPEGILGGAPTPLRSRFGKKLHVLESVTEPRP